MTLARSPRLGYALAAGAAALWALNGSISKALIQDHGVTALRLAQLRVTLSWVLLATWLALVRPELLRVRREDVRRLAVFGIAGLAMVQATYFVAIERLPVGVALTIQYLGPLLLLLWLRLVHGRALPAGLWGAAALSLAGAALVVEAYRPGDLDVLGVIAALAAAATFAGYLFQSERAGHRYPAVTTLAWGFGFATLFWAVAQPIWTFPADRFDGAEPLLLGAGVVVVGTLVPFVLMVSSVRHVAAPRAAVVATLEPVLAALIAWPVLGEALAAPQIAGVVLVVGAVVWIQLQRPAHEAEAAPAYGAEGRPEVRVG